MLIFFGHFGENDEKNKAQMVVKGLFGSENVL